MKRKALSIFVGLAMIISVFGSFASAASATTVRDLPLEGFAIQSATPQELGRWDGYTGTVTDGANGSRIIAYSGTSTGSHISLSIPQSAVNDNPGAKPYILHLSYRIENDRTNPAVITHRMQYKQSGGSGSYNDIFVTDTSVFKMNPDTSLNITGANAAAYGLDLYDYKIDLYENLKTGAYQIYLNGVKWISAYDYSTAKNMFGSNSYTINEYRIRVTGAANSSWAFKLVNPCYEIYSQDVLMDDIIAYSVSGMSNYLNTTASEVTTSKANKSGTVTITGVSGTENPYGGYTSYTVTGVASGSYLAFWDGTTGVSGKHKPLMGANATAEKAWYHIGYNITGNNVGLKTAIQFGNTSGSSVGAWDIIPEHKDSDYRADFFFDLSDAIVYIYYNNAYDSYATSNLGNKYQFRQIRLTNTTAVDYTISNLVFEYYADGVTPGDMMIGYDERTKEVQDYIYQIDGIRSGTNVIGKMDGLCTVTGDNSGGYTLAPNSINGSNGGFARYNLNYTGTTGIYQSSDDKVLLHTVYYKPQTVSGESKHQFGIRGGTDGGGYYWFLTANAATNAIEDHNGNKIKTLDKNTFYRIDFILNNKDYKYYLLLDGICVNSGTLYSARQPIWQIAYTQWNTSDRMILKNMRTTLYKNNYGTRDIAAKVLEKLYAEIGGVSESNGELSVNALYTGPADDAGNNTKALYALYNSEGKLLDSGVTQNAQSLINGNEDTVTLEIPDSVQSGDVLTVKACIWNLDFANDIMTPITKYAKKSYTVQ